MRAQEMKAASKIPYTSRSGNLLWKKNHYRFRCSVCDCHKPLTHFLTSPKCWRSIQRRLRRQHDNGGWDAYSRYCQVCDAKFYWGYNWAADYFLCPKCYVEWRKERRNELARKAYNQKRVASRPICQHCSEKFKAVRSDAKFCSAKCRVAGNRAKTEK